MTRQSGKVTRTVFVQCQSVPVLSNHARDTRGLVVSNCFSTKSPRNARARATSPRTRVRHVRRHRPLHRHQGTCPCGQAPCGAPGRRAPDGQELTRAPRRLPGGTSRNVDRIMAPARHAFHRSSSAIASGVRARRVPRDYDVDARIAPARDRASASVRAPRPRSLFVDNAANNDTTSSLLPQAVARKELIVASRKARVSANAAAHNARVSDVHDVMALVESQVTQYRRSSIDRRMKVRRETDDTCPFFRVDSLGHVSCPTLCVSPSAFPFQRAFLFRASVLF